MNLKKAITAFINSTDKTLQKKHVLTVKTYNYKQIGLNPKVVELSKAVLKVKVIYADLKGTDSLDTHIRPPRHTIEGKRVVLHRTASGVLRISLNLYQRQIPFIVLGGLAKYFTQELAWFEKIKAGDTKGIPKSFLATYPTQKAVVNVEEKTKDPELTRVIKIINLAETLKMGNLYDTINHIDKILLVLRTPLQF